MMINNNPYSLPDKNNQNARIYTEISSNQFKRNDSSEHTHGYSSSSGRNNGISSNLPMKKSSIVMDEFSNTYRPPVYPTLKSELKNGLPSPKNHTSSNSNIPTYIPNNGQRPSFNLGHN